MKNRITSTLVLAGLLMAPHVVSAVELVNPLGETDVRKLIGRVVAAALSIAGSLAFLMFVYGGMLWLTSRGDSKQIQKGKDILVWTTLGIVMIFSAYVITGAIIRGVTTGSAT